MTRNELIDYLKDNFKYYDTIACNIWSATEVKSYCKDRNLAIRDDQIDQVLEEMHSGFDRNVGLTWDVLEICVDFVLGCGQRK